MENQYNYYHTPDPFEQMPQTPQGPERRKKKGTKKGAAVVGFAILFGFVSSATFLGVSYVGGNVMGLYGTKRVVSSVAGDQKTAQLTQTSSVVTSDVSSVVEQVMPSVVSITNMSVQQVQDFFGGVYKQNVTSAGTGIIVSKTDDELLIVTNNHVVADSQTLTVTFDDQSSVEAAIKGTDSRHDLAVIAVPLSSVSDETMGKISVAKLGDSTKLKVGEPAIAIGNALGYGQSVTTGVISATDRTAGGSQQGAEDGSAQAASDDVKLIQTDAAINPGNSGGALVNASGEVIGINSSKLVAETVEGVGYAIPISDVSDIITNLMNQQTRMKVAEADQGTIGIRGFDVSQENAKQFNMPIGVYISEVVKDGGAEKAGLTKGMIITGIEGQTVSSMDELKNQLQYYKKGTAVTLKVQAPKSNGEYEEKDVQVTLGSK